eukprot:1140783-Amphidinium_carterae.1
MAKVNEFLQGRRGWLVDKIAANEVLIQNSSDRLEELETIFLQVINLHDTPPAWATVALS